MIGVVIIIGLGYAALVLWLIQGWCRIPYFKPPQKDVVYPKGIFFTVLIPARNEENVITDTLNALYQQNFPYRAFEVIVIDDHSTDSTAEKVKSFRTQFPDFGLKYLKASVPQSQKVVAYKKLAIEDGIEIAQAPWIVTTDADCKPKPSWLKRLYQFINKEDPYMVSGPVEYEANDHSFKAAQRLEFTALIGIGAASLKQGMPSMCNGANLAYLKSVFQEVNGFEGVKEIASGDDELLMHKVHEVYPDKVRFLKHYGAMVITAPLGSFRAFLQQRRRWASKGIYYQNPRLKAIMGFVGFFHLLILILPFLPNGLILGVLGISFKLIPECIFLLIISTFFRSQSSLPIYLPIALVYPFYVVGIGILSQFGEYYWKGRKLS